MAQTSPHLQWLLLRNHNSFLVKRDGVTFSREANNLLNRNSFKFSGLAHKQVVGVETDNKGGIVVSSRKAHASRGAIAKGARSVTTRKITNFPRVAKTVKGQTRGRRDLRHAALARWTKIDRSLKAAKKIQKKAAAAVPAPK